MSPTSKKEKRFANKCKKMAALLNITKLNEQDRQLSQGPTSAESVIASVKQQVQDLIDGKINIDNFQRVASRDCMKQQITEPIPRKHVNSEINSEEEPPKKTRPTKEDFIKIREELRVRHHVKKSVPRLRLKNVGENASLALGEAENRIPIFLSDLQHLLLYSFLGHHSPYIPSRWCYLEKINKIMHTVVFVIDGLTANHYESHQLLYTNINKYLKHRLEVITPSSSGGSVAEELVVITLTGTQKQQLIEQFGSLQAAIQSTDDLVKSLKSIFPITSASKQKNIT